MRVGVIDQPLNFYNKKSGAPEWNVRDQGTCFSVSRQALKFLLGENACSSMLAIRSGFQDGIWLRAGGFNSLIKIAFI